ncbi:hypothetical protein HMPREF3191_00039 [Veillonellaceae bacterium DNF00626]|nr:hypothetical protein HMPREF3191_00039 [Veillonellaceae bacterium DNF00626]
MFSHIDTSTYDFLIYLTLSISTIKNPDIRRDIFFYLNTD